MSAITSLRYFAPFTRAIESGSERKAHACLKKYQRPIWVTFAHGWNSVALINEFRVGQRYRCDFLLVSVLSGAVHATFIELKPPDGPLYVKDGSESLCLKRGLRQLKDWSMWVRSHPGEFRDAVADHIDRLAVNDPRVPSHRRRFIQGELRDSRIALIDNYAVVIGRRKSLSPDDNARRGYEQNWSRMVEIVTYDRFLDIAAEDRRRARELRTSRGAAV